MELNGRMKNKFGMEAKERGTIQEDRIYAACKGCDGGAPGTTLQLLLLHKKANVIKMSPDPTMDKLLTGQCGNPGCTSTSYELLWDGGERI